MAQKLFVVRVDIELQKKLKEYAEQDDRSCNKFASKIIKDYIRNREAKEKSNAL